MAVADLVAGIKTDEPGKKLHHKWPYIELKAKNYPDAAEQARKAVMLIRQLPIDLQKAGPAYDYRLYRNQWLVFKTWCLNTLSTLRTRIVTQVQSAGSATPTRRPKPCG